MLVRVLLSLCLLLGSASVSNAEQSSARDSLFSITPEQMVFAAKLSESYRKIYCHNFSMIERQEALDEWLASQEDGSETAVLSPDDAVQEISEQRHPDHTDPFIDLSSDAS